MDREKTFLLILVLMLLALNYSFLDSALINLFDNSEYGLVERVIDGDTVVINGTSVRLLGINSPEKGEKYSKEATEYLESKVLNKTVRLEYGKEKFDLYGRKLSYLFLGTENVNLGIVLNGYSNFYFPSGKDVYYSEFKQAWENCLDKKTNLCEMSNNPCALCIELKELSYKGDKAVFYNKCSFSCDLSGWKIKDEGRKNFIFENFIFESFSQVEVKSGEGVNTQKVLFWTGETYVWTKTGDTLFLRDSEGKLVLWSSY
ncbi:MAG: thermonuclease family protein [Nanoarchaeota archaeon]|nr:thermonuclease family protein [Nanoarchaeota archaeon]